jgi:hypothetical protein
MVIIEGVAVAILIFIIVFQVWQSIDRQREWDRERRDLLNRIMTRNYAEFVNGQIVQEQITQPMAPAYEEERGIPII